ncbi:MAG TPA: galactosylceramidase [Actinocrinis sp.]|nr:galactosylceramidase [Actinocrinis sp.]
MAAMLAVLAVALPVVLLPSSLAQADAPSTTITVDGSAMGPEFYGVGAISGGGGNSVYLKDYPEPERTDILNYLFSPDYGADLQVLKVEIGGDTNSTDGSEPSIEHGPGAVDCGSGYEWWLMEQAQQRNPNIVFYGLQWAAPSWVGGTPLTKTAPAADGKAPKTAHKSLWTTADVDYVMDWMRCASSHNLKVSYLGGWNESGWNPSWYESMRAALNTAGYTSTRLVAADSFPYPTSTPQGQASTWNVAKTMHADPAFDAAVSVLGAHDVCGYPTTGYTCVTTPAARSLDKPLWASELGHMDGNRGAPDMIRAIVDGYDQAGLTGFITWPIVSAMPQILPKSNYGLVNADQPWAGNYTVNEMTWAIGQVTQFTSPGWHYVDGANKVLTASGSYNTLESPNRGAWSLIAQTTTATQTQDITVDVAGGLPSKQVNVWATNLNGGPAQAMVQQPVLHPSRGSFRYTLQPGYVYTFSTSTAPAGVRKGKASDTATGPLSLPYTDPMTLPFGAQLPVGEMPAYFAPQDGAFQYVQCADQSAAYCVQQTALGTPVGWPGADDAGAPYALFGSTGAEWANYTVSANVLFPQAGTARLLARVQQRSLRNPAMFGGYEFTLSNQGAWSILCNYGYAPPKRLASGTLHAAPGVNKQIPMSLKVSGKTITASVNGTRVWSGFDTTYTDGLTGIGTGTGTTTGGFYPVQFTGFSVTP